MSDVNSKVQEIIDEYENIIEHVVSNTELTLPNAHGRFEEIMASNDKEIEKSYNNINKLKEEIELLTKK